MSLFSNRKNSLMGLLASSRDTGHLGHSYAVSGDSRENLAEFAQDFLKLLLCEKPSGEVFCGICQSCLNVANKTVAELSSLEPSSKSRIIRADDMRTFLEPFSFKTSRGHWKVGVIHDADRMQVVAQNIFLKTLEEPPERTIFILLSTKLDSLLPTTLSRCRRLNLSVNQTTYEALDLEAFQKIGNLLRPGNGAGKGFEASLMTEKFLAEMRAEAERECDAYKDEISELYSESSADGKKLKGLLSNFTESSYRSKRETFLSALETYYYQLALLASGCAFEKLNYPQFYSAVNNSLDWPVATACCGLVEELQNDLQHNVKESLAFDNFCFKITKKI